MADHKLFILNSTIVNEGKSFVGDVLIENGVICHISSKKCGGLTCLMKDDNKVIDAEGKYLFPGVIDGHVHFREPGLTEKADI